MKAQGANKIGFAHDIRPLFRDFDITSMKARNLDLTNYDQVKAKAGQIVAKLESGDMPCDSTWPDSQVNTFKQLIRDGKLP